MSISYGFYNSVNHDRVYDALDMSRIFDGIINDGVFMNIGSALAVTKGEGMSVNVGIGRAWFDHTWTYNDAILPLEIDDAELALTRIDAVVLEVDTSDAVRANTIKVITGPVGATPSKPALANTATLHQHALAYITIDPGDTEIKQANIATAIGTSETPFITGILETLSIDVLMLQWAGEFNEWFEQKQSEFDEYEGDIQDEFDTWVAEKKAEIEEYQEEQADAFTTWSTNYKDNFDEWFENLQYVLDGDVAGNLQDQISGTTVEVWSGGSSFKPLNDKLMDSSGVCVTPEGKTLKEAIADGSIGGGGRTLTQAEFDALTDYEKTHGTYYITDGKNEDGYDSTHVWYKDGTVYGALESLNSNLTQNESLETTSKNTWGAINEVNSKTLKSYSASERVVGTWINGKPLYEKTVQFNGATNGKIIDSDITHILIDYDATAMVQTTNTVYTFPLYNASYYTYIFKGGSDSIKIMTNDTWGENYLITVTYRYLKSTD